jgi:hypothetical protein
MRTVWRPPGAALTPVAVPPSGTMPAPSAGMDTEMETEAMAAMQAMSRAAREHDLDKDKPPEARC